MWAFSSDKLTVYSIQPGRGYEQASAIPGPDFDGFLARVRRACWSASYKRAAGNFGLQPRSCSNCSICPSHKPWN